MASQTDADSADAYLASLQASMAPKVSRPATDAELSGMVDKASPAPPAPPASPSPGPSPSPASSSSPSDAADAYLASLQASIPAEKASPELSRPAEVPQPEGMTDWLKEKIYPTKTVHEGGVINPKYENLDDWRHTPELAATFSMGAQAVRLGTATAGIEATQKMIEKHFPGLPVKKDGEYLLITSKEDGKTYAWKPGFRPSDIPRAILAGGEAGLGAALVSPLVGTGLIGGAVVGGLGAGAGALATESIKGLASGGFDPWQIPFAAALGAGGSALAHGATAVGSKVLRTAGNMMRTAAPEAPAAPAALAPVEAAAVASGAAAPAESAAVAATPPVEAPTPPSAPAVTPPAVAPEVAALQQRGDELMRSVAQNLDNSGSSVAVRDRLTSEIATTRKVAKDAINAVGERIPKGAEVHAEQGLDFIASEEAGGKIPKWLKRIRDRLSTKRDDAGIMNYPTYEDLNTIREEVGFRSRGKGPFGRSGLGGNKGLATKLYEFLNADQRAGAEGYGEGLGQAFDDAQAKFRELYELEAKAKELFGKKLNSMQIGSLSTKVRNSLNPLAKGDPSRFANLMNAVPDGMRQDVIMSHVANSFGDLAAGEPINLLKFGEFYRGVMGRAESKAAFLGSLDDATQKGLSDLNQLSQQMKGAMSETAVRKGLRTAAQQEIREVYRGGIKAANLADRTAQKVASDAGEKAARVGQVARKAAQELRAGKGSSAVTQEAGRRAEALAQSANAEFRQAKIAQKLAHQAAVAAKKQAAEEAKAAKGGLGTQATKWVVGKVPGGNQALAAMKATGAFDYIMKGGPFKRVMDAAAVPQGEWSRWLEDSITKSASKAIPLAAAGTPGRKIKEATMGSSEATP